MGAIAAAAVAAAPGQRWMWQAPSPSIVLESTVALVSMLTAFLVFGRYRQSSQLADLAIVYAFAVVAAATLLPPILPSLVNADDGEFVAQLRLVAGLVSALGMALAAIAKERRFDQRAATLVAALGFAVLAPVASIVLVVAVDTDGATHESIGALRLVAALLFAVAALGLTLRAEQSRARGVDDQLTTWMAAACTLGATYRFIYVLAPDDPPGFIHIADVFRLGFSLMLLVGAAREIAGYWRSVGVLDERRRIARELHDGMAQELAFIVTQSRRKPDAIALYRIAAAAERALDESRRAILALTHPVDQPLDEAIAQTAEDVAGRAGAHVRFSLVEDVHVSHKVRENLVRIVREAVANATRHGQAANVEVTMTIGADGLRLRVIDDGHGFDPSSSPGAGRFGLQGMEERTRALGGRFEVRSHPGEGTQVEVDLPWSA
ncbi:MAG TPA: sensor histidine kinase [Acidimicrobiales bacterium]|nr:sensor histidine kinase [Acidimicrobiales bacterium]